MTTIYVNSLGLPDQCYELKLLRNFRDNILLKTNLGVYAVKNYYAVAPEIISNINTKEKDSAIFIWLNLYPEILKAVFYIINQKYNAAFEHYKNITLNLKNKYCR